MAVMMFGNVGLYAFGVIFYFFMARRLTQLNCGNFKLPEALFTAIKIVWAIFGVVIISLPENKFAQWNRFKNNSDETF